MPARRTSVAPARRRSRILRDNRYRPCAKGARYDGGNDRATYVAHLARQSIPPRAHNAHATMGVTTVPRRSRILRDHPHRAVRRMRTLPPCRVRRASCATIDTARAPKAHATTVITTVRRTSRILRDNPHRSVRTMRTLRINRTLYPKFAAFISIYPYYYL